MTVRSASFLLVTGLFVAPVLLACSSSSDDDTDPTGSAGSAGASGAAGAAGDASGGSAGASGGSAGMAGATALAGGGAGGESGGSGGAGGDGGAAAGGGGDGGMGGDGGTGGEPEPPPPFELVIPGIEPNEDCGPGGDAGNCPFWPESSLLTNIGGQNMSPEMSWGPGPEGTLSYAITMQDLSNGNPHWSMWDIPADVLMLPEGLPSGAMPDTPEGASQASFVDGEGWAGSGARGNVYELILYALNVEALEPNNPGDHGAVRQMLANDDGADNGGVVLGSTLLRARSNPNP